MQFLLDLINHRVLMTTNQFTGRNTSIATVLFWSHFVVKLEYNSNVQLTGFCNLHCNEIYPFPALTNKFVIFCNYNQIEIFLFLANTAKESRQSKIYILSSKICLHWFMLECNMSWKKCWKAMLTLTPWVK